MKDLLHRCTFTCNRCKGKFNHTEGTWLPLPPEKQIHSNSMVVSEGFVGGDKVPVYTGLSLTNFLRPPEVLTSDEFTCYDCITEEDGQDEEE